MMTGRTRWIATLVAGLAGAAVVSPYAAQAAAPTGDVKGPACLDIVAGSGVYDGSVLAFRVTLAGPACRAGTYTLVVADSQGGSTIATATPSSVSGSQVFYTVPVSQADGSVCVSATTSLGGRVFDTAPDAGCIEIAVGDGSPAQQFR